MPVSRDDVLAWITAIADVLAENKTYLTELDAAIGDADHGANMDRGFKAVMNKMPEIRDKDIVTIFKTVGMTLLSTVGGAGGYALWHALFASRHENCRKNGNDGRRLGRSPGSRAQWRGHARKGRTGR